MKKAHYIFQLKFFVLKVIPIQEMSPYISLAMAWSDSEVLAVSYGFIFRFEIWCIPVFTAMFKITWDQASIMHW